MYKDKYLKYKKKYLDLKNRKGGAEAAAAQPHYQININKFMDFHGFYLRNSNIIIEVFENIDKQPKHFIEKVNHFFNLFYNLQTKNIEEIKNGFSIYQEIFKSIKLSQLNILDTEEPGLLPKGSFALFQKYLLINEANIAFTYVNCLNIEPVSPSGTEYQNYFILIGPKKPSNEIIISGNTCKITKVHTEKSNVLKGTRLTKEEVPSMIKKQDFIEEEKPIKIYLKIDLSNDIPYLCLNNNIVSDLYDIRKLLEYKTKQEIIDWYRTSSGFTLGENLIILD